MKALFPDQMLGLDMLRASIRQGKRRPMFQAPVGYGKTVCLAEIIRRAVDQGRSMWVIVDAIALIDQTIEKLEAQGVHDIGVVQADHPRLDYSCKVQVLSVQTMMRRAELPAKPYMAFVDEAHVGYDWLFALMAEWRDVIFVGLSATPWAKGLGLHYDDLIRPIGMAELIESGRLCPYRAFGAAEPDLAGVGVTAGEYREKQLSAVMSDDVLVADIIDTWVTKGDNRPTLAFGVDRAHAKKIQTRFENAGIGWGYIDAFTDREARLEIKAQLDRRQIAGVANVGTLVKGVDWEIGCIIDACPNKSEMNFVQKFGRGLRVNPSAGPDLIYLDHARNIAALGYPETIYREALCTRQRGEKAEAPARTEPLPKPCPKCTFIKAPKQHSCPSCGFKPEAVSTIGEAAGELFELAGEIKKAKAPKKADPTPADKERFYRELLSMKAEWGKKDTWPDGMFKAKFGHWPARKHGLHPLPVSSETASYVRSRQIAFAKRRAA